MSLLCRIFLIFTLVLLPLTGAVAAPAVYWTDWNGALPLHVDGSLTIGANTVGVQFSGTYYFAQISGGTNYWVPSAPYISSTVPNAPPDPDIIALYLGGTVTITFSQPVKDPLLALVSWNGNTVEFGVPIKILSYGHGYWGNGTPILNASGTGFYGDGEVHGVIELPGVFSAISFTHTTEGWHGLTVGVRDIAVVPLPGTLGLLGSGLLGLLCWRRRR